MLSLYKKYGFMINQLVSMDIRKRYSRSFLGVIWSMLNPLLTMCILSVVFTQIFTRSIENYPIYYLSGNIMWTFFYTSTSGALTSLVGNRRLLTKINVPKLIFPISKIYANAINFLYILIAFAVMLVVFQVEIKSSIIMLPVILLSLFAFTIGVSFILSILYIFFGDLQYLYSVICTAFMYTCAIFYPIDIVPEKFQILFRINPMFNYIHLFRKAILYGTFPNSFELIVCFGWSLIMICFGYLFFKKFEKKIMYYL